MVCLNFLALLPLNKYPLDMAKHINNCKHSYVHTDVEEFVSNITNNNIIRVALRFLLPQYMAPLPFE